jgi:putative restriction endonuclease
MSNGILLRADLHKLYDSGYITVTRDYRVEVSKRIREKFENGREYYQYDGKELLILPKHLDDQPHPNFIEWHNNNIYNG